MATGANIQQGRGIQTTNLPARSDVSDGAGQVFDELGNIGDKIRAGARPALAAKARQLGAQEGMDAAAGGDPRSRTFDFGEVAAAREAAYGQAYMAGVSNDFDGQEAEVRRRNPANPDGYEMEMRAVRSGFIQGADPAYAVDIEQYAMRRGQAGLSAVADQAAQVRLTESNNALVERLGGLEGNALALIDEGRERTVEFEFIRDEYEQLIATRIANPEIPYSQEEGEADLREFQVRGQSRAAARAIRQILETEGSVAALDEVTRLQTDPEIDPIARPAIVQAAREAAQAGISAMQQRVNITNAEKSQRESELARLVDEDVAGVTLSGEGTGLTADQVYAVGGNDAVVDWLKKRADAHEFHNLVGNLPLNDPDAAAEQIAGSRLVSGAGQDFNGLVDWIIDESEGTALVQNDNGAGRARFGITERSHPDAWRDGDVTRQEAEAIYKTQYWDSIGADALSPGLRIVAFDAAINHGAGKARQWITESRGDPTRFLELRREHYRSLARQDPAKYGDDLRGWENRLDAVAGRVGAMGASMQSDAWEQYTSNRQAAAADPGSFVQNDFAVRSAREEYQAAPNSVTASESYIDANIAAQDRAGIREGDRATLPGQALAVWAGDLERYARAGDTAGFQALSEQIVRRHGRYGERVLQDVLETRGDTRWAAVVSARASTASAAGQRQPPAAAANAQSAVRAEQISRTAGGTARDAEAMSTEELRAAAGL